MKIGILIICASLAISGCAKSESDAAGDQRTVKPTITINVKAPDPMLVPARVEVKSPEDWPARTNNKEAEVIETINLINPVAVYLIEGFKLYGDKFSPTLHDAWDDTQNQLKLATGSYDQAKKLIADGKVDKDLYLKLEDAWQGLVKTGVVGIQCKQMMDNELTKL